MFATQQFSSEDSQNALSAKQALTGTQITIKGLEEKTGDDEKVQRLHLFVSCFAFTYMNINSNASVFCGNLYFIRGHS